MKEKRKVHRLNELNKIKVSIISKKENLPKEKVPYNYSDNISVYGAKIRGSILLPVNTLLRIDFTLKTLQKQITVSGKVIWIKMIIEDNYYETGIEFVDTPGEAIKQIQDYILSEQKKTAHKPTWIFTNSNEQESKQNNRA
jgi:hypothetical protein